jgi:hypothetical protein
LVEKYKKAILAAGFGGELTREWRLKAGVGEDRAEFIELPRELRGRPLPISWKIKPIADAAINHDGKRIPVRAADRALRRGEFAVCVARARQARSCSSVSGVLRSRRLDLHG